MTKLQKMLKDYGHEVMLPKPIIMKPWCKHKNMDIK
jgi:hypothetical protein